MQLRQFVAARFCFAVSVARQNVARLKGTTSPERVNVARLKVARL
jgi:hypothetical protein